MTPNDDHTTKSINYLINSYLSTVGQNSNLLPNLSPDKSGRFPAKDAKRLVEFGKMISENEKTVLLLDALQNLSMDGENLMKLIC